MHHDMLRQETFQQTLQTRQENGGKNQPGIFILHGYGQYERFPNYVLPPLPVLIEDTATTVILVVGSGSIKKGVQSESSGSVSV